MNPVRHACLTLFVLVVRQRDGRATIRIADITHKALNIKVDSAPNGYPMEPRCSIVFLL